MTITFETCAAIVGARKIARPESIRDQIATVIQTGHLAGKSSHDVAGEVLALLAEISAVEWRDAP